MFEFRIVEVHNEDKLISQATMGKIYFSSQLCKEPWNMGHLIFVVHHSLMSFYGVESDSFPCLLPLPCRGNLHVFHNLCRKIFRHVVVELQIHILLCL